MVTDYGQGTRINLLRFASILLILCLLDLLAIATSAQEVTPLISSLAWSLDGRLIAVAGGDWQCGQGVEAYGIRIFDVSTQTLLHVLEGHTCTVITIEWSPDGNYLVSGSADETARVWDTNTGELITVTPRVTRSERVDQSWNPDGTLIADVFDANRDSIFIWDAMSGQPISTYESPERASSHKWNSDSNNSLIAIGIFNGVQLLDPHTMTIVRSLPTSIPSGDIITLLWSPDNTQIAGGSVDGIIHIWNVASGVEITLLVGHSKPVLDLAWNPDGTSIISSALDKSVRIWDVATSQQIEQFATQGSSTAVAWIPDGSQVAFSGNPQSNSPFGVDIVPAPSSCSTTILASDTPALLSAITSANVTPEADTICLEAGTYTLDAPITSDITLVGLGAGAEIIGTLQVSGAGRLTLRNVTVNP
jgi:WD40 repeat protein